MGIGFSRGTSWLIQLAGARPGLFEKIVLLAPFPPPGEPEALAASRFRVGFPKIEEQVLVVGASSDGCACDHSAHPEFWNAVGLPWLIMTGDHGSIQAGAWKPTYDPQWLSTQPILWNFVLTQPSTVAVWV